MKILFDQGTPAPLRLIMASHSVDTAYERGWQTLENGQLLDAAEREGDEVFVTTDQNLRYHQNFVGRKIANRRSFNNLLAANQETRGNNPRRD